MNPCKQTIAQVSHGLGYKMPNIEAYTGNRLYRLHFYDIYSFTGAHPNSFTVFFNFNKETGDTISLANIFKPGLNLN